MTIWEAIGLMSDEALPVHVSPLLPGATEVQGSNSLEGAAN